MTKSTITRERLEEIVSDSMINQGSEFAMLARMALAAMDSEPVRNPVLAYADSYRDMAKQGVESVPIWSVITDLERNIAPLYRHAQPVPRVPDGYVMVPVEPTKEILDEFDSIIDYGAEDSVDAWHRLLAAATQLPGSEPAAVPGRWIPVSERMPETDGNYWGWWSESKRQGPVWFIKSELQAQFQSHEITHWMPLPDAPQEEKP